MIVQSIINLLNLVFFPPLAYQNEHADDRLITTFIINFTEWKSLKQD